MLISTKPDSKGKEAAVFRSRQLTEFVWIPVGDIPIYTKTEGKTKLPAGVEVKGMIYSSTETVDKFIAENVSFETMLSVIANPDSALYHKDLNGHGNSWAYFGVVCNGLVRYALNILPRYPTKRWQTIPGMHQVAAAGKYSAEDVQLCDVLLENEKIKHVMLITDILRDETGAIRQIEVSEATRPHCMRRQFDLAEYFARYKDYHLWRYDYVDSVPMPDEEQDACLRRGVPGLPVIAVDYGNKANYREGEDVVISCFAEGENAVEVCCGDQVVETVLFRGRGKVTRRYDRGYYTLRNKTTGDTVEFCVTAPEITYTVENGKITIKADAHDPESGISHMDFRERSKGELASAGKDHENSTVAFYSTKAGTMSKLEELTEEEKETGIFTREIPCDAENFKVYFRNKYGVWTHTMIKIQK